MDNALRFVQQAREHNHALVDAKRRLRALNESLLATIGAESLRVLIYEARKARGTAMYHARSSICKRYNRTRSIKASHAFAVVVLFGLLMSWI